MKISPFHLIEDKLTLVRAGSHGSAGGLGRRRLGWTLGSMAGHGAVTERCGGGWAASPSEPSRRRTAWGSVTAPRIRRGPAQRAAESR